MIHDWLTSSPLFNFSSFNTNKINVMVNTLTEKNMYIQQNELTFCIKTIFELKVANTDTWPLFRGWSDCEASLLNLPL